MSGSRPATDPPFPPAHGETLSGHGVKISAEVLRPTPAVAGAVVGVPEVIVAGPAPEHILGAVRLSGGEGPAAEGPHAQARRCVPRVAGRGVGVPQVPVGTLPEHIDRAGC